MDVSELPAFIKQANSISFIIGAGASKSAGIPLALELIKQVEESYGHCLNGLSSEDKLNYGKVMSRLSPQERKDLIEPLLDNASLNWGHLALARIIEETNVRRVLSFNFDFLLEQAVGLLGNHLPVYDFGIAPASNITGLADKALFHLHGQSYGLKLLNSADETKEHAEDLRPLLKDSLCNHVTIVTGYSGNADGAFGVMKEEYNGNNRLFWLGYSNDPSEDIAPLFEDDYAFFIGGCDFDLSMIEIARGLGCWPLPILDNPPEYVRQLLRPLPAFPTGEESQTAVLHETRMRLERMTDEWRDGRSIEEKEAAALMSGVDVDFGIDTSDYTEEAKQLLAWRFVEAAWKLRQKIEALEGDARAERFAEIYKRYAEALRIKPDMHEAFNNWGGALSQEAQALEGDMRAQRFAEAYEKYAEATRINPDYDEAFNSWGIALSQEAQALEGDARAQRFVEAYEKYAEATRIEPDKHHVFNNWGIALSEEAQALEGDMRAQRFAEAYEKYAEATRIKPDLREGFNNWGGALLEEAKELEGDVRTAMFDEARTKLERAKHIHPEHNFNLACLFALQGKTNLALDELEGCTIDATLPDRSHLLKDPDLNSLHSEPRFEALIKS